MCILHADQPNRSPCIMRARGGGVHERDQVITPSDRKKRNYLINGNETQQRNI